MSYAMRGFGAVGQALARAFARKNIKVAVASRRPPEALAPQARAIGPTVVARVAAGCTRGRHNHLGGPVLGAPRGCDGPAELGRQDGHRRDNCASRVPVEDLEGQPSSAVVAKAFAGARFVKGFNHLPAAVLAADPSVNGGSRVVFLSSDDENAVEPVAVLAEQLGFAPIVLGPLKDGGSLVQARGNTWAELIFKDLVKFK
jgi:predicted dinucleotide-binding enzyme